jgi:hypothetical protein
MTSPDLSMKVDYFGIRGLKLGLSGYFGKSESALYKSLDLNNDAAVARADSSVTGIFMTGLDARYSTGGLSVRGQFVFSALSNTAEYNKLQKATSASRSMACTERLHITSFMVPHLTSV